MEACQIEMALQTQKVNSPDTKALRKMKKIQSTIPVSFVAIVQNPGFLGCHQEETNKQPIHVRMVNFEIVQFTGDCFKKGY